jgi:hypothetical protein
MISKIFSKNGAIFVHLIPEFTTLFEHDEKLRIRGRETIKIEIGLAHPREGLALQRLRFTAQE